MWSWLTGGGAGGGARHRGGSFFSRPREFSLESMRQLHAQLLRFTELGDADVVELLRVLSEFLVYSDQNQGHAPLELRGGGGDEGEGAAEPPSDSGAGHSGVFFDYFCEKNILGLFLQLGASRPSAAVQVQLLQTLSILVQNIATRTSLYYLLSNNYVNRLLECPFAHAKDDDVRDWYVTLLKALSLRLNEETVQFFFDDARASHAFPLYAQALKFRRCPEAMVKVAVKTLTLNVYRVQDDRVRRFILQYQKMAYFRDIVEYANELALQIQGLLNAWGCPGTAPALADKLEEAVDEYIDHCFYLQDILDVNLPELCYKVGDLIYKRHVRRFLAASLLPDCSPPPQRVSTRLALYLLTRLVGIFEHAPLVNAVAFMLLSPDASERCPYSAVALGAGSRHKSSTKRVSMPAAPATTPTTIATPPTEPDSGSADSATAEPIAAKRKPSKKKRAKQPPHVFQPHSAGKCDSPMCYLQTRFGAGEWPLDEVERFVPSSSSNCFRQSLLALLASSDELLSSAATLLLLAVVNNDAVDHTLLRELDLLPFRHRRHKKSVGAAPAASSRAPHNLVAEASGDDEDDDDDDNQRLESSAVSLTSSSDLSVSSTSQVSDTEGDDGDVDTSDDSNTVAGGECGEAGGSLDSSSRRTAGSTMSLGTEGYVGQYPHWLMDVILAILARSPENRLLSTQLAARLLVDLTRDSQGTSHWLLPRHSAALKEIHSGSTHQVMESMRGAMADVDLFIYVLEDEFEDFERSAFPAALNFKSSSPFEFLVPPVATDAAADTAAGGAAKSTLNLRRPASEMEVCRKSMRAFLTLRKLRALVDEHYAADSLEQFVAFRHPHTSALATAARDSSSASAVSLDGMVFLRCMWREQRFLHAPAKLLMVLNPEALVLAEKSGDGDSGSDSATATAAAEQGVVRLFAPIHRTYCAVDGKDERVLHVSVSSAVAVAGCRSSHKRGKAKQSVGAVLKNWHVSVLFESREDCRQAKAHVDLSRAEVRAFKLLQIEESLTTHVRIPRSADAESPKTKARRMSMDVEERRLKHEGRDESESE
ncbi:hypothetical protein PybrP1_001260 [[Pythium] brassicae (nom. inval.)]|nr:hypothetical protein PybrP1_001260 [[Pythium] brassicae (nom. inval.)]